MSMPYSIIRSGPQSTSSTPQSEASNSNQSQKDQELQIQNSSDGLAPSPFSAHGAIGSGPSTSNLENSLQKAQENFIKSQIEVRKNQRILIPKVLSLHLLHYFVLRARSDAYELW
jgi:E3 ubiquitin-protein ligase synoviolin